MRNLILIALVTTTFISCGKNSKKNNSGNVTYDTSTRYVGGLGYTCDRREVALSSCIENEIVNWCAHLRSRCQLMSQWQLDQQRLRARNFCLPYYPLTICN